MHRGQGHQWEAGKQTSFAERNGIYNIFSLDGVLNETSNMNIAAHYPCTLEELSM
jgi:hypothetical protein